MRWKIGRRSTNVEDRRDEESTGGGMGGGGFRVGWKTMLLVGVVGLALGQNPLQLLSMLSSLSGGNLGGLGGGSSSQVRHNTPSAASNEEADFVSAILADTEDTWSVILSRAGKQYQAPHLVLFTDQVNSACGMSSAATGPFYCPGDQKVYIDLGFFQTLSQLGASGDFARAYVVGHEVGHHIQNLLGVSDQVHQLQQRMGQAEGNGLSVRLELQADCYAGVWAHHANKQRQLLEPGDVEEGLQAAASIGDDRLQGQAGHRVSPESFTHGSAEQRVSWLNKGLQTGDINACNTFTK
ncbi:MAG: flagellar biosynthesis protein FlgM [Methylococcaceae bacterium]|nr:flagellar biosynthesis protein FlgM [Methylococcaceae bacterium]